MAAKNFSSLWENGSITRTLYKFTIQQIAITMLADNNTNPAAKDYMADPETQVFNPITGHYVKRNSVTGKLGEVKLDGQAFKGVKQEESITNVGIAIPKAVANKAEQAVITTLNNFTKPAQTEKGKQDKELIGLRSLLERIEPEYRELINLSYFKGLTQEEISKLQGVPVGIIKKRLRVALNQLRNLG